MTRPGATWPRRAPTVVAGKWRALDGRALLSPRTGAGALYNRTLEAEMTRRLAREEALFAGTSSGANVVAAIRVAERLGPEATVVTLMADSGLKYLNTDVYRRR